MILMGSYGRTGRRRKRKREGDYRREFGAAVFEQGYIELLKWAKRNGISFGKLRPAYFRQTGRGLMTCRKLSKGDLVISVPEKMLITTKTAERSQIVKTFIKLQPKYSLTAIQILCIFILYEKFQGGSSFWYPYIRTLPTSFNTPAYFKAEELSALPSSLQQQCVTQTKTVRESFEELKGYVENDSTMLDKAFLDFLTFDEFRWAWFVVNTRSVFKANCMDLLSGSRLQTQDNYALAPVLDLLNHNDTTEVYRFLLINNLTMVMMMITTKTIDTMKITLPTCTPNHHLQHCKQLQHYDLVIFMIKSKNVTLVSEYSF